MWTKADNYDAHSRNPFCSVTGLPKLPEEQFIFRLADIEFEGSFDIGQQVVQDMAVEFGMVTGDKHEAALTALQDAGETHKLLVEQVETLEETVERLQIENAHLRVGIEEMEALIEEDLEA